MYFLLFITLTNLGLTQTLNIADTSGKGKVSVFASANSLVVKGFTTGGYNFSYATYGLTNRLDLYAGANATTFVGRTQLSIAGGGNIRLISRGPISLSSFSILSTPLHRRTESCGLSFFEATIVSRKFTGKEHIVPYIGYSVTVPLGQKKDKLFTPPSTVHNIPLGAMVPLGKILLFMEFNYGRTTKAVGVGVSYGF